MRSYFVLTIYGLILLLHGCSSGISQQSSKPAVPAKPNTVVALGRIQPNGEVIKLSVANAQDSRVDRILVAEGDRVKRNQVIAILQGIDRRQADLRDALVDVKLREIELGKVSQGDVKKSQISAQNAAITRTQAQLTNTRTQQSAALNSAQSRLDNAEADYKRQERADREGLGLLTAKAKLANAEAEYATLKAIGYSNRSLLIVIFQEALFLAVLSYIPGFIATLEMYQLLTTLTKLELVMTINLALTVFILTLAMCLISGAITSNKLRAADPADVF